MSTMARIILLSVVLFMLHAKDSTPYERDCVGCHATIAVGLDKFFMRYVLQYSSERAVKNALFFYLKAPQKEHSVMGDAFLRRYGVKKPSTLNDTELKEAIKTYYQRYDVKNRLKP